MAKKEVNKKKHKKEKKFFHRLRNKYRLLVINEATFDERLSFRLSPLNVIATLGFIFLLVSSLTVLLIIYTPAKEWIPGYPNDQIRKQSYHAATMADSLSVIVNQHRRYNRNLQLILSGEVPVDSFMMDDGREYSYESISFSRSPEDSILRERFEEEEKYNIVLNPSASSKRIKESLLFFPPVRGQISGEFNVDDSHLGIDLTAAEGEPVMSTLDGTVILATWTSEAGYVIEVMHKDNLLSVYKHNSILLHQVGDKVTAGEAIAIIGNTGEMTTGPHLHFELWHEGTPLNPVDFIIF
jgi:murein DD-endopeptidase MepM/ murein hydrolase activator NlpD